MSDATPAAEPTPGPTPDQTPGVFARFIGIIFSPAATMAAALKDPSPYGILFLAAVVIAVGSAAPQLSPEVQRAVIDMQISTQEAAGVEVTPEARQALERFAGLGAIFSLIAAFVFTPIGALFFGALFWGIFNALLGGTATFKEVLTVVSHGMVIAALGVLLSAPMILLQGQIQPAGPFNLGALVPMMDSSSFLYRLMSSISVFTIWQTIVVAIGLGVLYRRKSTPIVVGLLLAYVAAAAVLVAVFGRFTRS